VSEPCDSRTERCDPRLETRRRSSDRVGIHAGTDRDNHRSPRFPEDGTEAMLGDPRRWHPASRRLGLLMRVSTRASPFLLCLPSRDPSEQLEGCPRGMTHTPLAEASSHQLTSFLAFNDARGPRRSTVHPRSLDSADPKAARPQESSLARRLPPLDVATPSERPPSTWLAM